MSPFENNPSVSSPEIEELETAPGIDAQVPAAPPSWQKPIDLDNLVPPPINMAAIRARAQSAPPAVPAAFKMPAPVAVPQQRMKKSADFGNLLPPPINIPAFRDLNESVPSSASAALLKYAYWEDALDKAYEILSKKYGVEKMGVLSEHSSELDEETERIRREMQASKLAGALPALHAASKKASLPRVAPPPLPSGPVSPTSIPIPRMPASQDFPPAIARNPSGTLSEAPRVIVPPPLPKASAAPESRLSAPAESDRAASLKMSIDSVSKAISILEKGEKKKLAPDAPVSIKPTSDEVIRELDADSKLRASNVGKPSVLLPAKSADQTVAPSEQKFDQIPDDAEKTRRPSVVVTPSAAAKYFSRAQIPSPAAAKTAENAAAASGAVLPRENATSSLKLKYSNSSRSEMDQARAAHAKKSAPASGKVEDYEIRPAAGEGRIDRYFPDIDSSAETVAVRPVSPQNKIPEREMHDRYAPKAELPNELREIQEFATEQADRDKRYQLSKKWNSEDNVSVRKKTERFAFEENLARSKMDAYQEFLKEPALYSGPGAAEFRKMDADAHGERSKDQKKRDYEARLAADLERSEHQYDLDARVAALRQGKSRFESFIRQTTALPQLWNAAGSSLTALGKGFQASSMRGLNSIPHFFGSNPWFSAENIERKVAEKKAAAQAEYENLLAVRPWKGSLGLRMKRFFQERSLRSEASSFQTRKAEDFVLRRKPEPFLPGDNRSAEGIERAYREGSRLMDAAHPLDAQQTGESDEAFKKRREENEERQKEFKAILARHPALRFSEKDIIRAGSLDRKLDSETKLLEKIRTFDREDLFRKKSDAEVRKFALEVMHYRYNRKS